MGWELMWRNRRKFKSLLISASDSSFIARITKRRIIFTAFVADHQVGDGTVRIALRLQTTKLFQATVPRESESAPLRRGAAAG
jgi:hypothetical protein